MSNTRSWVQFPGKGKRKKRKRKIIHIMIKHFNLGYKHLPNGNENQYYFVLDLLSNNIPHPHWPLLISVCFVNGSTRHFCINACHTYAIYQLDICNVLFSQMFPEEVIPAFQSCQNPQNTQCCKFGADEQHACRREKGIRLNIRGQRVNHRRNEQEHWRYILRNEF